MQLLLKSLTIKLIIMLSYYKKKLVRSILASFYLLSSYDKVIVVSNFSVFSCGLLISYIFAIYMI